MIKVIILGTGNVAKHLFDTFLIYDNLKVVQVVGRNKETLSLFDEATKTSSDFNSIEEADIYIIAISDDAIPLVAETLTNKNGLIVHTSGNTPMEVLDKNERRGVLYPLQTFSKGQEVDFKTIPICIEAENKNDVKLLRQLSGTISDTVVELSSQQRGTLHLAAVFVNNFTNHLYHIGHKICAENELPFDLLKPLILETAEKIQNLRPIEVQTGPAKRDDQMTMEKQIKQLKNETFREIYSLLSQSIKETYGEKL